jgi:hypothetical protein
MRYRTGLAKGGCHKETSQPASIQTTLHWVLPIPNVKIQIPNECQMLKCQDHIFSIRVGTTAVSSACGIRLMHESVHSVTPACSWRGSRELEESGFPPGACGNDDRGRAPTVFEKLPKTVPFELWISFGIWALAFELGVKPGRPWPDISL